jgi:RNA polymerase sigma factor (sigma-70 family)
VDSCAGTAAALRRSRDVPAAFTDVYRLLTEPVLIYFTRRTYDPEVALELTAETFARTFSSRRQFRGHTDAEAQGWVFAVARNLITRWYRDGEVEQRAVKRLGMQLPQIAPDDYERIERAAEMDARREDLSAALRALSDEQRDAVRRRVTEERPYAEIAPERAEHTFA